MLSADNTKRPDSILDFFFGADFKATKMADKHKIGSEPNLKVAYNTTSCLQLTDIYFL